MHINNYTSQTSFTEKYPVERLLSCACEKPFIRKSESINLITSLCKLTKEEKRNAMRYENVFESYMKKAGDYILAEVPSLKYYARMIDNSDIERRNYIINKAVEELGDEINVERLKKNAAPRKGKNINVYA